MQLELASLPWACAVCDGNGHLIQTNLLWRRHFASARELDACVPGARAALQHARAAATHSTEKQRVFQVTLAARDQAANPRSGIVILDGADAEDSANPNGANFSGPNFGSAANFESADLSSLADSLAEVDDDFDGANSESAAHPESAVLDGTTRWRPVVLRFSALPTRNGELWLVARHPDAPLEGAPLKRASHGELEENEWRELEQIVARSADESQQDGVAQRVLARQWKAFFQEAAAGKALIGMRGETLDVNAAMCALVGRREAELLELFARDLRHPDDRERVEEYYRAVLRGGAPSHIEARYRHRDGRYLHCVLTLSVVRDSSGRALYFAAEIEDISARRQAQIELERRTRELEHANAELTRSNAELERFAFIASHDLQEPLRKIRVFGDRLRRHLTAPNATKTRSAPDSGAAGEIACGETTPGNSTSDKVASTENASGENASGENASGENASGENASGENASGENALSGITFGEVAFGELAPSEVEMGEAAVGKAAASELASSELASSELALGELALGEPLRFLDGITRSAERMQLLIDDLLEYGRLRGQAPRFESVDLNQLWRELAEDVAHELNGGRLEIGQLPRVWGDRARLRQLFANLLSNSLKFRGSEPPLVRVRWLDQNGAVENNEVENEAVEIEVSDNGIGFEASQGEAIFEVFRRLHGRSEFPGTGIGLALCRFIAREHGGDIRARSQPGAGAQFVVRLKRRPHSP